MPNTNDGPETLNENETPEPEYKFQCPSNAHPPDAECGLCTVEAQQKLAQNILKTASSIKPLSEPQIEGAVVLSADDWQALQDAVQGK